jgi:ribose transport system permease protein
MHALLARLPRRAGRLGPSAASPLLIALGLVVLCFSLTTEQFLSTGNLVNVLRSTAVICIVAAGVALALTTGALDVSFPAVMSLSAMALGAALERGWPVAVALLAAVLAGAVAGGVNAVLVVLSGVDALVITLGTLTMFSGVLLLLTDGVQRVVAADTVTWLGRGDLAGIPAPVLLGFVVVLAAHVFSARSTRGAVFRLVGDSPVASTLLGVSSAKARAAALVLVGLAAAVGGVLVAGNAGVATPNAGAPFLLPVLAAVVLGGIAMSGGAGNVLLVGAAAILLATIDNGLNLWGVSSLWQDVLRAGILIAGLGLQALRPHGVRG